MHPLILPASDHAENLAIHPLFHEHVSERLHQRTNPILGLIGEKCILYITIAASMPSSRLRSRTSRPASSGWSRPPDPSSTSPTTPSHQRLPFVPLQR